MYPYTCRLCGKPIEHAPAKFDNGNFFHLDCWEVYQAGKEDDQEELNLVVEMGID